VGPQRPVADAARLMLKHKIGALPVVDAGRLVGIVTESDMLRRDALRGGTGMTWSRNQ
jgi:CBS domain-containing protein